MGAWGSGNFENDAVLDWLAELEDPEAVRSTLRAVANAPSDSYLDADDCCTALGAAEIVAACSGRPAKTVPDKVAHWAAAHPGICDDELRGLAAKATARIEAESELQELFDEGGPNEEWHAVLRDLVDRLSSAQ